MGGVRCKDSAASCATVIHVTRPWSSFPRGEVVVFEGDEGGVNSVSIQVEASLWPWKGKRVASDVGCYQSSIEMLPYLMDCRSCSSFGAFVKMSEHALRCFSGDGGGVKGVIMLGSCRSLARTEPNAEEALDFLRFSLLRFHDEGSRDIGDDVREQEACRYARCWRGLCLRPSENVILSASSQMLPHNRGRNMHRGWCLGRYAPKPV